MTATTDRAEFLKSAERLAIAENAVVASRWGEDALDTQQSSVLALESAAQAEAARQLAQLSLVRARDAVVLSGVWPDLEGSTVSIDYGGRFGLAGVVNMLVIRTRVDRTQGRTEIEGEIIL